MGFEASHSRNHRRRNASLETIAATVLNELRPVPNGFLLELRRSEDSPELIIGYRDTDDLSRHSPLIALHPGTQEGRITYDPVTVNHEPYQTVTSKLHPVLSRADVFYTLPHTEQRGVERFPFLQEILSLNADMQAGRFDVIALPSAGRIHVTSRDLDPRSDPLKQQPVLEIREGSAHLHPYAPPRVYTRDPVWKSVPPSVHERFVHIARENVPGLEE